MKKILIIGSSGFIGSNISEYLKKSSCYDIYAPSSTDLDATNEIDVKRFLENKYYDVIIHCAVDNSSIKKYKNDKNQMRNTLQMFYNFEKYKHMFGKMLYFGSGAEYDKSKDIIDVCENDFGRSIPDDDYGFAKYIISKQIEKTDNIYNLRLFGVFGENEYWKTKFISNICCKSLKNIPLTIRQNVYFDYLWINDLCKIVDWFINNTPKYRVYNVTTGKKIDLLTIANIVNSLRCEKLPIFVCKEGLANEYTSNNSRLLNEIKDMEFTPIEESIKQLLLYYKNNIDKIDIYSLLY